MIHSGSFKKEELVKIGVAPICPFCNTHTAPLTKNGKIELFICPICRTTVAES